MEPLGQMGNQVLNVTLNLIGGFKFSGMWGTRSPAQLPFAFVAPTGHIPFMLSLILIFVIFEYKARAPVLSLVYRHPAHCRRENFF